MSRKNDDTELTVYTEEQAKKIEEHIEQYFGEIRSCFNEKKSDTIKLSINVIPPTRKKPYYTLVTSGMGAYVMNVPENLKEEKYERAELVICLPPDWNFENESMEYYWPLQLLDIISRLPIKQNVWLGWGHTIDYGTGFADNVPFSGIILVLSTFGKESCTCDISDDETVNFYQVVPIFETELDFKNKNGASALLGMFPDNDNSLKITDPDRSCYVPDNFREILDTVRKHSSKITKKGLDILEINGANHISAFLRWSWENNLINDEFAEYFAEDIQQIKDGKYDIRKFLINSLNGELTTEIYTDDGKEFCEWYYDYYSNKHEYRYPHDVDEMALDYFGEEKYNCDEFQDEAYLFVPFDEAYYEAMSKYINRGYMEFLTKDIIDSYNNHACKIEEKKLKVDKINAVNHIAVFLMWCIEHKLVNRNFMKLYNQHKKEIEAGSLDIRNFITEHLSGLLPVFIFNRKGEDFAHFYYSFTCEPPSYPDDVDKMALAYFGEKKYNSKKFKDEAYLFVPFDENYITAMNECIDRAYADFCYFRKHGKLPD